MTDKIQSRKRPYFNWYGGDFIQSTARMVPACRWHYLRLLWEQWAEGSVPIDQPEVLELISPGIAEYLATLAPKFPDGMNPRLAEMADEMMATHEKRAAAGRKGAAARYEHDQDSSESDTDQTQQQFDPDDMPVMLPAEGSPANSPASGPAIASKDGPAIAPKPIPTPIPKQIPKPKPSTKTMAPDTITNSDWDQFKQLYPARAGGQGWKTARARAEKAIKNGASWADITAGADRYRIQAENAGNIGTATVKQAQTFMNPDTEHWTESYPVQRHSGRTMRNASVMRNLLNESDT